MNVVEVLQAGPYNALYAIGFAAALALAVADGRRRGWPVAVWAPVLAATVVAGVAGSKLLFFDPGSHAPGAKTFLGGLLAGAVGLWAAARVVRLGGGAADALVPAVPAGLALGRIGCFLAGCCYGRPTTLAWGVTYGPGTEPYQAQQAAGLLVPGALRSLPVHPAQLVEAALDLLLGAALWRWRARFTRRGSLFLAWCAGYGLVRSGVELLRAGGGAVTWGLSTRHWAVLAATVPLVAALAWRERGAAEGRAPAFAPSPDRAMVLLAVVAALLAASARWFTPLELVVCAAVLTPAALVAVARARGRPVVLVPSGAVAMLVVIQAPAPAPADSPVVFVPRTSVTVGGSAMTGHYVETCGPEHSYQVTGASLGVERMESPELRYSAQLGVFTGHDDALPDGGASSAPVRQRTRGVVIKGTADTRYAGFTVGLATGDPLIGDGDPTSMTPVLGLRVGRLSGTYLNVRVLDFEPVGLPRPLVSAGLGRQVSANGSRAEFGISGSGFFVQAGIVSRQVTVEPFVAIGEAGERHAGLGLRYRFGAR